MDINFDDIEALAEIAKRHGIEQLSVSKDGTVTLTMAHGSLAMQSSHPPPPAQSEPARIKRPSFVKGII